MRITKTSFNASLLSFLSRAGDLKIMYLYALSVCSTAGYGYISIEDFHEDVESFCGVSNRTAKRWVTKLIDKNLVKCKSGILHPVSKRKMLKAYIKHTKREYHSVKYIEFTEDSLKSYKKFRNHFIRQYAVLKQSRFRHSIKRRKKGELAHSLVKRGKVETQLELVYNSKQAGCSISQLVKSTGFNKSTISKSLKGCTEKQWKWSYKIIGSVFRKKYKPYIEDLNKNYKKRETDYKYSYKYYDKDDTYKLGVQLASIITEESMIKKIKYNRVKHSEIEFNNI